MPTSSTKASPTDIKGIQFNSKQKQIPIISGTVNFSQAI